MANSINTIDLLGEEVTLDGLINGTLTEFYDNELTVVGQAGFSATGIKRLILPSVTVLNTHSFSRMFGLQWLELCCHVTIPNYALYTLNGIKTLILRSESLCAISSFVAMNTKVYIYVPRALIEDYKVATNWTTFADRFRAIEDYTVDGTITGEFDESKM